MGDMRIRIVMSPSRPINQGSKLTVPSWFGITNGNINTAYTSLNEISNLIDEILQEEYEICQNIFLGGFSQGGVVALYTGLVLSKVPLLGVVALSSPPYMINTKLERKHVPLFLYHGSKDEIINEERARLAFKNMFQGMNYTYNIDKDLGHMYSWREFELLKTWMMSLIPRGRL